MWRLPSSKKTGHVYILIMWPQTIYKSLKFHFLVIFKVWKTLSLRSWLSHEKAGVLENTSLVLVAALQGLSCPDKSAGCSAAALSWPCDITIAWRKVFHLHGQRHSLLEHAHRRTLAESTLHLLYGCGSCCASKACQGKETIMTATANMNTRPSLRAD